VTFSKPDEIWGSTKYVRFAQWAQKDVGISAAIKGDGSPCHHHHHVDEELHRGIKNLKIWTTTTTEKEPNLVFRI
jgi:hypothetical protein